MNNKAQDTFSLGPVSEEDGPFLVKWFNDPVLSGFMTDTEENKIYTQSDIDSMITDPQGCFYFAFKANGRIIGYGSIYDVNPLKQTGEFSFLIGDPGFRGKGLGCLLVSMICQKAQEIGLKKLTCSIYSENKPSVKSVEKNGFIRIREESIPGKEFFFEKILF
ncbi:MAG: GNAT family N-acetyltransferase [Candidatus Aureabacteria bacterium]|nr:GNAT family N-acetyltransferase [Candidatus Auribacterota bacterium]